jgi:arginyl-tRNA synthetase
VLAACQYLSPKEVAQYCHQLSVLFNEYYEKVQVIREPDQVTRNGRLLLVSAFSTVLSQGMELLGIPRRERI